MAGGALDSGSRRGGEFRYLTSASDALATPWAGVRRINACSGCVYPSQFGVQVDSSVARQVGRRHTVADLLLLWVLLVITNRWWSTFDGPVAGPDGPEMLQPSCAPSLGSLASLGVLPGVELLPTQRSAAGGVSSTDQRTDCL